MKSPTNSTFTRSLFVIASGFYSLCAFGQSLQCNTLVIDQGADLNHSRLKNYVNLNRVEANGTTMVDDDLNGYVDDLSGWNAVSNDGTYMPDHVLKKFTVNPERTKKLLALYTGLENGDPEAKKALSQNPAVLEILSEILGLAHGTHVAGIIDANSSHVSRLQSLNVFVGSQPPQTDGQPIETIPGTGVAMKKILAMLSEISSDQPTLPGSGTVQPQTVKSVFDDLNELKKAVVEGEQQEASEKAALSNYLEASKSKVVNLSLGSARANYRDFLENLWADEVQKAGLEEGTRRSVQQEANFQFVLNGLYRASSKSWGFLFGRNSDVLFVIAAGNDGVAGVPDAGNLDINPVTPADLSVSFPNVITIAATDNTGVLTDFSCFSASKVNIAAWGKAVLSLAPGENQVAMSGTSMAAPLVAGVATRVRAINPSLTAAQTRALIERTAKKLAALDGKVSTGGFIDAEAAFAAAQGSVNHPLNVAIEDSFIKKFDLNSRFSLNMLRIGTAAFDMNTDPTHKGQISETDDLVLMMIKKVSNF